MNNNFHILHLYKISYIQGVCEAIRGPTLLDLQDVYDTELETITLLFLVEGVGSLIGSFASETLSHTKIFLFIKSIVFQPATS